MSKLLTVNITKMYKLTLLLTFVLIGVSGRELARNGDGTIKNPTYFFFITIVEKSRLDFKKILPQRKDLCTKAYWLLFIN